MTTPKRKQASIKLNEETTRQLLDATKAKLKPGKNAEQLFLEELERLVREKGLQGLVEGISTDTKFHDLIVAGN